MSALPGPSLGNTKPSPEDQRRMFEAWYFGEPHQAYMAKVAANGGVPLNEPEKAFDLYRRRWSQPASPEGLTIPTLKVRTA